VLLLKRKIEAICNAIGEENSMSDQMVESAKEKMGAVEALLKGLPGIRGYVDKELRRATDKRLREQLADALQRDKDALLQIQKQLLANSGLKWVAKVDSAVQRLQTTIDRIRSASYGYAGFFSDVRIREEELDALYRFDQSLATQISAITPIVDRLATATAGDDLTTMLEELAVAISAVDKRFGERNSAITAPEVFFTGSEQSFQ